MTVQGGGDLAEQILERTANTGSASPAVRSQTMHVRSMVSSLNLPASAVSYTCLRHTAPSASAKSSASNFRSSYLNLTSNPSDFELAREGLRRRPRRAGTEASEIAAERLGVVAIAADETCKGLGDRAASSTGTALTPQQSGGASVSMCAIPHEASRRFIRRSAASTPQPATVSTAPVDHWDRSRVCPSNRSSPIGRIQANHPIAELRPDRGCRRSSGQHPGHHKRNRLDHDLEYARNRARRDLPDGSSASPSAAHSAVRAGAHRGARANRSMG